MRIALLFWLLLGCTLSLYLLLVIWSLPRISEEAGGAMPFDLRPLGYTFGEAQNFLEALSDDGREFYLGTQHRLDLIYPAMVGTTFATGFSLLFKRKFLWVLMPLALSTMAFDWLENMAVAGLLRTEPASLEPSAVAVASLFSILKSFATTLAWLLLLGAGAAKASSSMRMRQKRNQ